LIQRRGRVLGGPSARAAFGGNLKPALVTTKGGRTSPVGGSAGLAFLFIMLIPYHLPIEMYLVAPEKAGTSMRSMSGWLLDHSRMLEIVVGLGFEVRFLWKASRSYWAENSSHSGDSGCPGLR